MHAFASIGAQAVLPSSSFLFYDSQIPCNTHTINVIQIYTHTHMNGTDHKYCNERIRLVERLLSLFDFRVLSNAKRKNKELNRSHQHMNTDHIAMGRERRKRRTK